MGKDRIAYLDLVKFVAILLVCIGHCYVNEPKLRKQYSTYYLFFSHAAVYVAVWLFFSP